MAGLMVAIANSISSNYVASAGGGYDPDAEAFIIATGISGGDANAINELVLDLKGANIWTKFNALYPIIGTTATQQKFNLKNPADTNAAFRLSFSGGWTHSATGATPNGINAYADTNLIPSTTLQLNSTHLSFYSRTNVNLNQVEIGNQSSLAYLVIQARVSNLSYFLTYTNTITSAADTNSAAFYIGNRTASNVTNGFRNNVKIFNSTLASTSRTTNAIYIGAMQNLSNVASTYSNKECSFASIGSGLNDTESQLFYQIVEKYQVALGRNINPLQSFYYNRNYNNEANAYLFSTQIADTTQQVALNTLVSDMKTYGIWSKMKAVYPVMGTTATQQKFNLVNPQDTNAAYRLTFAGGWTHASTGMTPDGTNAYANTNFIANGNLSLYNSHQSYYSRTSGNPASIQCFMGNNSNTGVFNNKAVWNINYQNTGAVIATQHSIATATDYANATGQTSRAAFWMNNRTSSTSTTLKVWKNGSSIANATTTPGGEVLNTSSTYLGARRNTTAASPFAELYTDAECAFASIGDGLTDTEAANFYTAVQNFQTSLGRQV